MRRMCYRPLSFQGDVLRRDPADDDITYAEVLQDCLQMRILDFDRRRLTSWEVLYRAISSDSKIRPVHAMKDVFHRIMLTSQPFDSLATQH